MWLLAILTAVASSMFGFLTSGQSPFVGDNLSTAVMAVGFLALAVSRNVILHSVVIPTFLVVLLWDIIRWHPVFTVS